MRSKDRRKRIQSRKEIPSSSSHDWGTCPTMNAAIRQILVEAARDVQMREIMTFLYRDHPQGASFEGVKEMLFLYDVFEESQLTHLVDQNILIFDGKRYKVTADARQILDRYNTIHMDKVPRGRAPVLGNQVPGSKGTRTDEIRQT